MGRTIRIVLRDRDFKMYNEYDPVSLLVGLEDIVRVEAFASGETMGKVTYGQSSLSALFSFFALVVVLSVITTALSQVITRIEGARQLPPTEQKGP